MSIPSKTRSAEKKTASGLSFLYAKGRMRIPPQWEMPVGFFGIAATTEHRCESIDTYGNVWYDIVCKPGEKGFFP
jgi:hypothetical protein